MSGRFVQLPIKTPYRLPWPALSEAFSKLPARYNLAPGQQAGVLIKDQNAMRLAMMHWGLLPFWAKELAIGSKTINARLETVNDKPSFRAAFKARHAVIPMSGYYEWQTTPLGKQPYYFQPENNAESLWVAGLWEPKHALQTDASAGSFTLITQAAEGLPASIHSRMPVFVEQRDIENWLSLSPGPSMPFLLTRSLPALKMHAVSKRVNSGREDNAELIQAL